MRSSTVFTVLTAIAFSTLVASAPSPESDSKHFINGHGEAFKVGFPVGRGFCEPGDTTRGASLSRELFKRYGNLCGKKLHVKWGNRVVNDLTVVSRNNFHEGDNIELSTDVFEELGAGGHDVITVFWAFPY